MAVPKPKSQENILSALMLAQAKQESVQTKQQLQVLQVEHQKITKEHQKVTKEAEKHKKKAELMEQQHKEARKELHKMKMQYDANYIFEKKQTDKRTMDRVRSKKKDTKAQVRDLQRTKRTG